MKISLSDIGKRYTSGWVFRHMTHDLSAGDRVAILGPNGSGKSTLLQIISGYLSYTEGKVTYEYAGTEIKRDDIYKSIAIATPYAELDEELTAIELFQHYKRFKPYLLQDEKEFISLVQLDGEKYKRIANYSSGMKQRLSLGLAMCMATPLLLLDEPTSFLDVERKGLYGQMLEKYGQDKTIVIASNDLQDVESCTYRIELAAS